MGLRKQQIKTKTATNKQTKFHPLQQQQHSSNMIRQHSTKQLNPEGHPSSGLWPKMGKIN